MVNSYRALPTNNVQRVGMNYLSDLIIRPGIEKKFTPLLLYRGCMNRGHAHRLWNMVLLMMAAECETLGDGLKVLNNPAFAQLCGPPRAPGKPHLWSFFFRLYDNPAVTKNIEGLTEYVKLIGSEAWELERVDRFSDRPYCASWRKSLHPNAGNYIPRERGIAKHDQLFYPYIKHDPKQPDDGAALSALVSAAVPAFLPDHIRADACQDLVVALLSGEITPYQVNDRAGKFVANVYRMHPTMFDQGGVLTSFNQPMPGTETRSWAEVV
jgi:hypothetical protein